MSFDESNQESNQNHSQPDVHPDNTREETNSEENAITEFDSINQNEFSTVEEPSLNGYRVGTDYFYSQEAVAKTQRNLKVLLQCEPGHIISLNEALNQLDEQGLLQQCVEKHGVEAVGTVLRQTNFQVSNAELRNFWL